MNKKGSLIVISGPSGVGKGTIVKELLKTEKQVCLSISCTTRAPRPGEKDGVHYHFLTKEAFEQMSKEGGFLEEAKVFSNYYGTPIKGVEDQRNEGKDVILEIDVQGALNVKKKAKDAVLIFVMPPSLEVLKERLVGRCTESEAQVAERLQGAEREIQLKDEYDYIVVNDDLARATNEIANLISNQHKK